MIMINSQLSSIHIFTSLQLLSLNISQLTIDKSLGEYSVKFQGHSVVSSFELFILILLEYTVYIYI